MTSARIWSLVAALRQTDPNRMQGWQDIRAAMVFAQQLKWCIAKRGVRRKFGQAFDPGYHCLVLQQKGRRTALRP
jgi:hypothetical protein